MRPHLRSYETVWEFERQVASFAGAKYGVATDSCTSAIFLSLKYTETQVHRGGAVICPARTYVSVPMSILHAGYRLKFEDFEWSGAYELKPHPIWDSALRFRRGMYQGGFHCVSFQMRKLLPIGKGGMVLTDDEKAAQWLRKARACGRDATVPYNDDLIDQLGWNMAMLPEHASRGLQLLERIPSDLPDQHYNYPDLRRMPVFKEAA